MIIHDVSLELLYETVILLLVTCSKELIIGVKNTCAHLFISALSTMARRWNQYKCSPRDDESNKNVLYPLNGVLVTCI